MSGIGREGLARKELGRAVARETGLTEKAAARALDTVIDGIRARLAAGERVMLRGFGTFVAAERGERRYLDMHTREWRMSPPQRVVRFIPSAKLKRAVNAEGRD